MTLLSYTAKRFDMHYTAPPACAKEILGDFRADQGFRGSRRAIRGRYRASGGQFAGTEARSARTAPGGVHRGEHGTARRAS